MAQFQDFEEAILIEDNRNIIREGFFFALISYISVLVVLSLLFKKENRFCLFHAKQGLVLLVIEVCLIILRFLLGIFFSFFYILGMLGCVILSVWGIFSVLMGRYQRLPLVGGIAEKIIL